MAESDEEKNVSRRKFLKNSGMVVGGVVGGSLLGGFFTSPFDTPNEEKTKSKEQSSHLQQARTFFSRDDDFETLAAATERIFPEDGQGPGAIELGVPYFIDKQLAGWWGSNTKDICAILSLERKRIKITNLKIPNRINLAPIQRRKGLRLQSG